MKRNCHYNEAIRAVYEAMDQLRPTKIEFTNNSDNYSLKIKLKEWDEESKAYWRRYYISDNTLTKFSVYPVRGASMSRPEYTKSWKWSKEEPMFAYLRMNGIKLYRPHSDKKSKWRSSNWGDALFNYHNLPPKGDVLIITSSAKDAMVLTECGFHAVAPPSETVNIPEDIVAELKSRFSHIFIFMDTDEAGTKANIKLSNIFNCSYIIIPSKYHKKDISDFIYKHGPVKTFRCLKQWMVRSTTKNYVY